MIFGGPRTTGFVDYVCMQGHQLKHKLSNLGDLCCLDTNSLEFGRMAYPQQRTAGHAWGGAKSRAVHVKGP